MLGNILTLLHDGIITIGWIMAIGGVLMLAANLTGILQGGGVQIAMAISAIVAGAIFIAAASMVTQVPTGGLGGFFIHPMPLMSLIGR